MRDDTVVPQIHQSALVPQDRWVECFILSSGLSSWYILSIIYGLSLKSTFSSEVVDSCIHPLFLIFALLFCWAPLKTEIGTHPPLLFRNLMFDPCKYFLLLPFVSAGLLVAFFLCFIYM